MSLSSESLSLSNFSFTLACLKLLPLPSSSNFSISDPAAGFLFDYEVSEISRRQHRIAAFPDSAKMVPPGGIE